MKKVKSVYQALKNLKEGIRTNVFLLQLRISCKLKGVTLQLGENVLIGENVRIYCSPGAKLRIGDNVDICESSRIFVFENAELSLLSGMGVYNYIHCTKKIRIGKNVMLGGYVSIIDSNHRFGDRTKPIAEQGIESKEISIGDDIWLGIHTTILPGAHLQSGTVVGAGAVVTKSFPKDSIIGGVPAKLIKER